MGVPLDPQAPIPPLSPRGDDAHRIVRFPDRATPAFAAAARGHRPGRPNRSGGTIFRPPHAEGNVWCRAACLLSPEGRPPLRRSRSSGRQKTERSATHRRLSTCRPDAFGTRPSHRSPTRRRFPPPFQPRGPGRRRPGSVVACLSPATGSGPRPPRHPLGRNPLRL